MLTRNGVCYDLKLSKFRSTQGELTFVFSSQPHKEKFEKRLRSNRETINYSLSKRFNAKIDVSTLADIVLYKKIETRGFLIVSKDGKLSCLEEIKYSGGKVTLRS